MPLADTTYWTDRMQQALGWYEESLLRRVANKLCKTRNQWPVAELIERCLAVVGNPAGLDRRLKELDQASRRALAVIGHSRQPRWSVGNLVEILLALGEADGLQPLLTLLEAGLLFPDLGVRQTRSIKDFSLWLGKGGPAPLTVFAPPEVSQRLLGEDLALPACPGTVVLKGSKQAIHEADGLEWPLRLAVLWQQVLSAPLRRTLQGGFFKRDIERLRSETPLADSAVDSLLELPDLSQLAVALAAAEGILRDQEGELHAGDFPATWQEDLPHTLASLWVAFLQQESWNTAGGWQTEPSVGNPYPSAYLLALLLLSRLPEDSWADPQAVEQAVLARHPFWATVPGQEGIKDEERRTKDKREQGQEKDEERRTKDKREAGPSLFAQGPAGLVSFLLGVAYQLRLVQAVRDGKDHWQVRLSPFGRWLLGFGPLPPQGQSYPQTLLVQPNLEILAYRQGLTPALIARLSRFAAWKGLSTACTLQLRPDTVYRALESSETFESLLQTLEQHGMKATPTPVIDSLRTWSNKRERLQVYLSAALFEFANPADLAEALARGLPATRLTDRLAVVADERTVDFRHFRLTGTRDYTLPPEKSVEMEADGVTLRIDVAKSDLLLETELQRFAELLPQQGVNGRRLYRITPASLATARQNGLSLDVLQNWMVQRGGRTLSAAALMLFAGAEVGPLNVQRLLVLQVPTEDLADGLHQWPQTRNFIVDRLGPTSLVIAEDQVQALRDCLNSLGINLSIA